MLRSLAIAALLALPAGAATPVRHLLSVNLKSEADAPWFAIVTDSPANFTSFKLRHPGRIVVDFPETSATATKGTGPGKGLVASWNIQNLGTREQVVARLTVELRSDADYTLSSAGSAVELHLVPATARPLVAIESERVAERETPAAAGGSAENAQGAIRSEEGYSRSASRSDLENLPLPPPERVLATSAPAAAAPVIASTPVQETTPGLKSDAPHEAAADTELADAKTRKARQAEEARALAEQQAAKDREAAEQQAAKEREAAEQRELAERKVAAEHEAAEQRELANRKAVAEHEAAEQRELAARQAADREAAKQHQLAEAAAAREAAALQAHELAEKKAREVELRRQQEAEARARVVAEKKARAELAARQVQEQRAARLAAAQERQERLAAAKRDRLAAQGRLADPTERRVPPVVLGQIGFHASEGGPEVIIHTSSPVTYAMREASAERLFLELDRTGITVANNRRPLETRFFGTAVTRIVPHEDRAQQHVSVEIDLASPAPYDIQAEGTTLRVRFHTLPVKTAVAGGPDPTPEP